MPKHDVTLPSKKFQEYSTVNKQVGKLPTPPKPLSIKTTAGMHTVAVGQQSLHASRPDVQGSQSSVLVSDPLSHLSHHEAVVTDNITTVFEQPLVSNPSTASSSSSVQVPETETSGYLMRSSTSECLPVHYSPSFTPNSSAVSRSTTECLILPNSRQGVDVESDSDDDNEVCAETTQTSGKTPGRLHVRHQVLEPETSGYMRRSSTNERLPVHHSQSVTPNIAALSRSKTNCSIFPHSRHNVDVESDSDDSNAMCVQTEQTSDKAPGRRTVLEFSQLKGKSLIIVLGICAEKLSSLVLHI